MKKTTFEIPSGYAIPEGLKEGDTYDASVTLKVEGGNRLCVTAVDGVPLKGYEEEAAEGRKSNPGATDAAVQADFAGRYISAMQGQNGD